MRAIFISYRRDDTEGEAGRLFDDLVKQFGETTVFMDVAAIEIGRDFRKAIDESVATCGVLLAVIGRNWLDAKNEKGERRLDQPSDFVRLETAAALKRDIPVIPVLVRGATMPHPEDLPDDLKELAYRNACELAHARWNSDLQLLIKALRGYVEVPEKPPEQPTPPAIPLPATAEPPQPTSRWPLYALALGAVLAAVLLVYFHPWSGSPADQAAVNVPAAVKPDAGDASQPIEVPSLPGLPLDAAEEAIRSRNLAVGNITREPDAKAEANSVLRESPSPRSKVAPGTAIDLVVAAAAPEPAKDSTPPPAESTTASHTKVPDFTGPWLLFEATYDGKPRKISALKPIRYKQQGDTVEIGKRQVRIMQGGALTYQTFVAGGRVVDNEAEATEVNTSTWRVDGDVLTVEITHYLKPQSGSQARNDLQVLKYRRVVP